MALQIPACPDKTMTSYFDNTGRKDVWTGGVRMIPIKTPKGTFGVWTKHPKHMEWMSNQFPKGEHVDG